MVYLTLLPLLLETVKTGVSDNTQHYFIAPYVKNDFMQSLQIANRKHDVVAIQVYDQRAKDLPDVGLMRVVDAETGFEQYVDTSSKRLRDSYRKYWMNRQTQLLETFNKSNVDNVSIATNEDFVKALMMLFKQRS